MYVFVGDNLSSENVTGKTTTKGARVKVKVKVKVVRLAFYGIAWRKKITEILDVIYERTRRCQTDV